MKKITALSICTAMLTVLFASCATATSTVVYSQQSTSQTTTDSTNSGGDSTETEQTSSLSEFAPTQSEDISSLLAEASSQAAQTPSYPQKGVVKKVVTKTYSIVYPSSQETSSQPEEQEKVKIMPIGEVTTEGTGGSAFREYLYEKYSSAGYATQYVGTEQTNNSDMKDGNVYHCGYGILTAKDIVEQKLSAILSCDAPDVIIVMLGRNDINANTPVSEFSNTLSGLIDALSTKFKDATVYVANVLPVRDSSGGETLGQTQTEQEYNNAIKSLAEQKQASNGNIKFIDLSGNVTGITWQNFTDSANGYMYPDKVGYEKIAQALFDATKDSANNKS